MKIKKPKGKYVLINIHRHENLNNKERLEKIIKIIKSIKIKAMWPIHANTAKAIEKFRLVNEIKDLEAEEKVNTGVFGRTNSESKIVIRRRKLVRSKTI